ncbi:MAG: aminotransferase [Gammaproteobacteria bacterium]|nr:aminotransferase [Gammaproteobacteria bacterium]
MSTNHNSNQSSNDESSLETLSQMDRAATLHPFTPMRAFEADETGGPRIVESGQGIRITDADGRTSIDGFAGLYCVNIGYGRTEVADAIAEQARRLAYYHCYAGHTTRALARLSQRLVDLAPGNMRKVFYGLSGSDANETQAKLVWHYHNLIGKTDKKKIIARERGYHGCSVISGSMTGMNFYHAHMDLPVGGILHTGVPHFYWGAEAGESEIEFSKRRAAELEQMILDEGPDTVGAFIAEPVLGTGGIIPPPAGYWDEIQRVLKRYDVLLIADEVVTAFGRIGAWFGASVYGIEPDLITVAKGITSAYAPLSAVLIGARVADALSAHSDEVGAFSHGYTYSGHPICVAAANANLDVLEHDGIVEHVAGLGDALRDTLAAAVADSPIVGEVRGTGMLAAIEFVADPGNKLRFDAGHKVGARMSAACLKNGLIARAMPHGDILGFAPPLITTQDDMQEIAAIVYKSVVQVTDELSAADII